MEPQDSIHIHTLGEAVASRRTLCRAIFGTPHVPRELPTALANQPSPVPGLPNGQRLTLPGCSDAFRWVPNGWNGTLVIVHQGHGMGLVGIGVDTLIVELFAAGYAVVGCVMPSEPHANIPLATFLRPVHAAITHAFATLPVPGLKKICMTGISGGGWTTGLAAAIDWRIYRSIHCLGTMPLRLRPPGSWDWEQGLPGLAPYTYEDLFILASMYPRRSVQVLADNDPVAGFGADDLMSGPDYLSAVQSAAPGFSRAMLVQDVHEYTPAIRAVVQTEVSD